MILTLFGSFCPHILLRDILPVSQATLHDALDELMFITSLPIFHKKWEVKLVVYVVWVSFLMWQTFLCSPSLETIKAHINTWITFHASYLNTFTDISVTYCAYLWP